MATFGLKLFSFCESKPNLLESEVKLSKLQLWESLNFYFLIWIYSIIPWGKIIYTTILSFAFMAFSHF